MAQWKKSPDSRQEHSSTGGYEAEEEDDDSRVLVVHEMVSQAGAAVGDAAIGKLEVEVAECGGDVDYE